MGTLTVDNLNVNSNITGGKINNPSFAVKKGNDVNLHRKNIVQQLLV